MVKARVNITTLATDLYPNLTLHRAGPHRKTCCCPFHEENTQSMTFDESLDRYKCFGCDRGGDVISFVQEAEQMDFTESVKYLLDTYCPEADTSDLYERPSPELDEKREKAKTLYEYNKIAYQFFREQYLADNEEAKRCRQYAETQEDGSGRWPKDYCNIIGLGYAPRNGQKFMDYVKRKRLAPQYS